MGGTHPAMIQRAVALVSMAPKRKLPLAVLQRRNAAVKQGQTSTHWPFLFEADEPIPRSIIPTLTELQKSLVG